MMQTEAARLISACIVLEISFRGVEDAWIALLVCISTCILLLVTSISLQSAWG